MTEYDPSTYGPMIDAILSVADLEKITVKRIRNALLELFAIDLIPHKTIRTNAQKEMNEIILERYYKLVDERNKPKATKAKATKVKAPKVKASKEEMEKQDLLMAIELLKSGLRGPVTRGGGVTKVVKKKAPRKTNPNSAFNAEHALSTQLQAVVGSDRMSRPEVVKQIWVYIKKHELQDPSDKRKIRCDDKLQALFKKQVVGMFEMNKLLGNHLYKDDDLVDSMKSVKSEELGQRESNRKSEDMVSSEDNESEMSDVEE